MVSIDVADAQRELSQLLERVQNGERFEITVQGQAVAELRQPFANLIAEFKAARDRRPPMSQAEIREKRDTGRR